MYEHKLFYEKWADRELKKKSFRERVLRWKANEIANLIRIASIEMSSKTILEIGCADGILLNKMRELFPQSSFIGLDISETLISYANPTSAIK